MPSAVHASAAASTQRVLHLINGEHYAGAERVQDLLALRLGELGFETSFACLKSGRFAELRKAKQAPLADLAMRSRLDPRPVSRLVGLIREGGISLLHSHTPRALLLGRLAALRTGTPLVHHVHSPTTSDSTHFVRDWFKALAERAALVGVSKVIAVSEAMVRYARNMGLRAERIALVHNGVPIGTEIARQTTPRDIFTLGTIALFRPRKGLENLLTALATIKARGLRARLIAVGTFETPEYEAQIKAIVDRLGLANDIEWRGFRQEINAELARFDLFVLPSLFGEGLPMVVLEAMAVGVPVVATRVEGVPEALRDGVEGLLAAPGDPADLARTILRCMQGEVDREQLASQARLRQAAHFSDEAMAAGVARVYREVLSR